MELTGQSRNVRQGIIEPHDFAKVLEALKPPAYAAVAEAAFITGWRLRSELLTLTWGQVDLAAGLIHIDPGVTKGGEARWFPVTTRLRAILKEHDKQKADGSPLVFHDEGKAIKPKQFYKAWKAACEAAKVGALIPHDLRRSSVREMERRQIPRQVSMELIGHKTESMFRRYAIVTEDDIAEAGRRLDQPSTAVVLHSATPQRRTAGGRRRNTN